MEMHQPKTFNKARTKTWLPFYRCCLCVVTCDRIGMILVWVCYTRVARQLGGLSTWAHVYWLLFYCPRGYDTTIIFDSVFCLLVLLHAGTPCWQGRTLPALISTSSNKWEIVWDENVQVMDTKHILFWRPFLLNLFAKARFTRHGSIQIHHLFVANCQSLGIPAATSATKSDNTNDEFKTIIPWTCLHVFRIKLMPSKVSHFWCQSPTARVFFSNSFGLISIFGIPIAFFTWWLIIGSLGWWFGFLGSPYERDCLHIGAKNPKPPTETTN